MRFVLEVDTDQLTGEVEPELARILRYWAGNLKNYPLVEGSGEDVYDSAYQPVGTWALLGPT
ncbi:hypothetical protein ACQ3I4_12795 [Zafaria sp. Z1313]|uniref:hypothetical protein n=1 Tax=unclassified Zafaria TaxID=2828765 RepID=UPI002E75B56B|nr:hypothetical protein [Zafaria sp. J156]MEE1622363.1 hypothetical protein [Zafaria sp. J156]